jgi:hypothetical protein
VNHELARRYGDALEEKLGWPGRMISRSKSSYRNEHPNRAPIFNANVCLGSGKLWWGDLDLTLDEPKLVALAERIGETVYILYEHDGRFAHEDDPLLERAVYSVAPNGQTAFQQKHFARRRDGSLWRKPLVADHGRP